VKPPAVKCRSSTSTRNRAAFARSAAVPIPPMPEPMTMASNTSSLWNCLYGVPMLRLATFERGSNPDAQTTTASERREHAGLTWKTQTESRERPEDVGWNFHTVGKFPGRPASRGDPRRRLTHVVSEIAGDSRWLTWHSICGCCRGHTLAGAIEKDDSLMSGRILIWPSRPLGAPFLPVFPHATRNHTNHAVLRCCN
jgi:hypothetical protein